MRQSFRLVEDLCRKDAGVEIGALKQAGLSDVA